MWIITNCIYHPDDLGALKLICGKSEVHTNHTDFHPRDHSKRDVSNELIKETGFSGKILLLKFKYAYARKSGYGFVVSYTQKLLRSHF